MNFKLNRVATNDLNHKDYYKFLNNSTISKIEKLSGSLKGLKVLEVNTDPYGGGVAVMLSTLVPLFNSLGLDASWRIIPPDQEFFDITKKIHNLLQGKSGFLTTKQKKYYLAYNQKVSERISKIDFNILIVHDPQPAACVYFLKKGGAKKIWRCHIDTTSPNKQAWSFINKYIRAYDHFIFTTRKYAHNDFSNTNISFFTPSIDPLNTKNKKITLEKARKIVKSFGVDIKKPFITQVSRFDPWKDPLGVIDSYRIAKKVIPNLQLVFVAQTSSDDPEETTTQKKVIDYAKVDPNIKFVIDIPNNDIVVNAFQTASEIILQKSIREGFGLTITEAMWKKAAVIGGNSTGIRLQIESGKNGFIVKSDKECANKIVQLLSYKKLKKKLGNNAHYTVKKRFLITNLLLNYLSLFKYLMN